MKFPLLSAVILCCCLHTTKSGIDMPASVITPSTQVNYRYTKEAGTLFVITPQVQTGCIYGITGARASSAVRIVSMLSAKRPSCPEYFHKAVISIPKHPKWALVMMLLKTSVLIADCHSQATYCERLITSFRCQKEAWMSLSIGSRHANSVM
jgi:hypothetical protein